MRSPIRVSVPPSRPLLVFDGDCNFCKRSVERLRQVTGDRVDYLPFQDPQIAERFPEIQRVNFEKSVQLIELDGSVYSGAEAIFRAVASEKPWLLWLYRHVAGFAPVSEQVYQFVAAHRTFVSSVSRWLWGESLERSSYILVRSLFLRLLALIYLIAFCSLWIQIGGLAGRDGIMPAEEIVQAAREQTIALQVNRFRVMPTLCWISAGDTSLRLQCAAGFGLSLVLLAGIAPALCLALLWVLYLSLVTVCPVFLAFQWDNLLLETGLLAIFFAPLNILPARHCQTPLSVVMLWLLRWLLFRLMFASGLVKLLSGDDTWENLTALNFHYETQPLPTWIGWYVDQLPLWFQKWSVLVMFGVELVVPFLIFLPRRARLLAFWPLLLFQLAIALTGNYGFFNLLTVALCFLLLDDRALLVVLPERWRARLLHAGEGTLRSSAAAPVRWRRMRRCHRGAIALAALLVLSISLVQLFGMSRFRSQWLNPLMQLYVLASPLRSVNGYGLFAVMTTSRPEIVVQGSNDGENWHEYRFKWKPVDVRGRPRFAGPHMPRLDWQMWFAALGTHRQNPWFIQFCVRLLQGSPPVLELLPHNPFPNQPPKYIRALLYEYRFTSLSERRATGQWWHRELKGDYCPVISLRQKRNESDAL